MEVLQEKLDQLVDQLNSLEGATVENLKEFFRISHELYDFNTGGKLQEVLDNIPSDHLVITEDNHHIIGNEYGYSNLEQSLVLLFEWLQISEVISDLPIGVNSVIYRFKNQVSCIISIDGYTYYLIPKRVLAVL